MIILMAASEEISKLQNNVNKFIKILKYTIPGSNTNLKCEDKDCSNADVVAFCIDCSLCLCKICYEYHCNRSANRAHSIALLDKISFCPEHPNDRAEYYCGSCDQFACRYCTTKDHGSHTHDVMEKMACKHRTTLTEIIAPVEEMSTDQS